MSEYMLEFIDEVDREFQHIQAEFFITEEEHFIFVNPYNNKKNFRIKKYLIKNIWVKNYDGTRA